MNIVTDVEFMRKYCRPTSRQEIEDNLIHEKHVGDTKSVSETVHDAESVDFVAGH